MLDSWLSCTELLALLQSHLLRTLPGSSNDHSKREFTPSFQGNPHILMGRLQVQVGVSFWESVPLFCWL